ncbi:uncharacterized protein J4E88_003245 [Alternaria novae-zelandiae]|uniref:uncharacterized protein n=1 Tax=Alternaria novae-zelandiae TaxID=430562 RepID=UPI0020C1E25B|nr:uncharacterized protein J4E88_003245 [Alternaria novae-zelandiae]KAI4687654.1 hypothetical protein J4E88_003245 [Alternaria novae-zelandiae]
MERSIEEQAYKTTDMGKTRKAMMAFIDSIPDSKLEGGFKSDTIYTDLKNFRLDNQGITTARGDKPACVNLQMQVNKRPKITSLADAAPFSVAHVEIPVEESWSAETIKSELKKSCIAHGDKTGHF